MEGEIQQGRVIHSASAVETEAIGAEIAGQLAAGEIALIEGEVGAGKTTLVRGVCRALGVRGRVTSPTFTIGQVYEAGDVRIAHLDLYRLADSGFGDPALLDDYLDEHSIGLVEWPGAGGRRLRERATLTIEIRLAESNSREVIVRW